MLTRFRRSNLNRKEHAFPVSLIICTQYTGRMENTLWNKVILSNFPDIISTFNHVNEFTFSRVTDTSRNPCFVTRTVPLKNIRPFPASTLSRFLGLHFYSDTKFMLHCAVVMRLHPLRSRCRTYSSRSLEPISRGIFICTNTYFIVANTSKTKYNNLRLKFVSEFKCYMEFRLRPFSFLFTQLSVGFNVVCRLHSITKLDA
jgi:hypothetical protein